MLWAWHSLLPLKFNRVVKTSRPRNRSIEGEIEGLFPSLARGEGRLEAVIIVIIMYVMPLRKKVSVVSGFLQSARRMIMHVKTGSVAPPIHFGNEGYSA